MSLDTSGVAVAVKAKISWTIRKVLKRLHKDKITWPKIMPHWEMAVGFILLQSMKLLIDGIR